MLYAVYVVVRKARRLGWGACERSRCKVLIRIHEGRKALGTSRSVRIILKWIVEKGWEYLVPLSGPVKAGVELL
jgi:hypothetical protein